MKIEKQMFGRDRETQSGPWSKAGLQFQPAKPSPQTLQVSLVIALFWKQLLYLNSLASWGWGLGMLEKKSFLSLLFLDCFPRSKESPCQRDIWGGKFCSPTLPAVGSQMLLYTEDKERPKKGTEHSRLVRGKFNKQGDILIRLVLDHWEMSGSPSPLAKSSKFIQRHSVNLVIYFIQMVSTIPTLSRLCP